MIGILKALAMALCTPSVLMTFDAYMNE